MRILFDQGTPVPIAAYLREHTVRTAHQEGWDRLVNGELLRIAEAAVNAAEPGSCTLIEIPK